MLMNFEWSNVSNFSYLQNSVETLNHYLSAAQTVVGWATSHPYWAVAIAILALTLLQTLLSLTSTAVRQALLWLLKVPFWVIGWLAIRGFRSTQRAMAPVNSPDDQVTYILQQLETLRHEQDALLNELKTLLADNGPAAMALRGVSQQKL
ncbi:MAG: hypothetical protein AAGF01_22475 [Cyanobacteria bacterium P01_G01_bin.38]